MTERRWFAIIGSPWLGYVLDYYPDEESRYRRELGKRIIGDFATRLDAHHAIEQKLNMRAVLLKKHTPKSLTE